MLVPRVLRHGDAMVRATSHLGGHVLGVHFALTWCRVDERPLTIPNLSVESVGHFLWSDIPPAQRRHPGVYEGYLPVDAQLLWLPRSTPALAASCMIEALSEDRLVIELAQLFRTHAYARESRSFLPFTLFAYRPQFVAGR